MSMPRLSLASALLAATVLAGCAVGNGGPKSSITIDSQPQGAQVYAGERALGHTPVTILLDDVFPKRWTSRTEKDEEGFAFYRRLGALRFQKPGCEPYSMMVDSDVLRDDIRVTLTCDPNYQPPADAAPQDEVTVKGVEERLRRLDELRNKGLLTQEEYRKQRERILNTL